MGQENSFWTPIKIIDKTDISMSKKSVLDIRNLKYIVIHRISLSQYTESNKNPICDDDLCSEELVKRFYNVGLGTGGRTPYHFLIRKNGDIEQMLPISARGTHAKGYNWQSVGVAIAGNSETNEIPDCQFKSLKLVCLILGRINNGLIVAGHTDLPGASSDPNKRCPGKYLNIDLLNTVVEKANSMIPKNVDYIEFAKTHGFVI